MTNPLPAPVSANTSRDVTGILLAAGSGSRLRLGPKAFLELDGRALVAHLAAEMLAGGCTEVLVVGGAGADRLERVALPAGTRMVANPDWPVGLSTSLRAGLAAGPREHPVLVGLVDQPGMSRAVVRRLLDAHAESSPGVVSAAYPGPDGRRRRGHPVVLDPEVARQVAAEATGDSGARAWLAQHPEAIRLVECGDLDDGADIDTMADLERWRDGHRGQTLRQAH